MQSCVEQTNGTVVQNFYNLLRTCEVYGEGEGIFTEGWRLYITDIF
jgi:hypothetical protein